MAHVIHGNLLVQKNTSVSHTGDAEIEGDFTVDGEITNLSTTEIANYTTYSGYPEITTNDVKFISDVNIDKKGVLTYNTAKLTYATGAVGGTENKGLISIDTTTLTKADIEADGAKFGLTIENGIVKFGITTFAKITISGGNTLLIGSTLNNPEISWSTNKYTISPNPTVTMSDDSSVTVSSNSKGTFTSNISTTKTTVGDTVSITIKSISVGNINSKDNSSTNCVDGSCTWTWANGLFYASTILAKDTDLNTHATKYAYSNESTRITSNCFTKYIYIPTSIVDTNTTLLFKHSGAGYSVVNTKTETYTVNGVTNMSFMIFNLTGFGVTSDFSFNKFI